MNRLFFLLRTGIGFGQFAFANAVIVQQTMGPYRYPLVKPGKKLHAETIAQ